MKRKPDLSRKRENASHKKESACFLEESKELPVSSNRTSPIPPVYPLHTRALRPHRLQDIIRTPEIPVLDENQRSKQHQIPVRCKGNWSSPGFRIRFRPEWNPRLRDYWINVLPKGSLLRMSNFGWLECTGYSLSSMMKSSNKGQTVGEKNPGIICSKKKNCSKKKPPVSFPPSS